MEEALPIESLKSLDCNKPILACPIGAIYGEEAVAEDISLWFLWGGVVSVEAHPQPVWVP
jgi:hypothetical protein